MRRKVEGTVVREIPYSFRGSTPGKVKLYFMDDDRFRIILPDPMREALGIDELEGKTPVEVTNKFVKACWRFESETGIEEKVILYKFAANVRAWRPYGNTPNITGKEGITTDYEEFTREDFVNRGERGETTLTFGYKIMKKRTFAGNVRYYTPDADVYECLNTNSNYGFSRSFNQSYFSGWKEIAWTEQREAFFKSAKGSFKDLIIKIMTFAEKDPAEAAKIIDRSQVTALLGEGGAHGN